MVLFFIFEVHFATVIDQELDELMVALFRGDHERTLVVVRVLVVDIGLVTD